MLFLWSSDKPLTHSKFYQLFFISTRETGFWQICTHTDATDKNLLTFPHQTISSQHVPADFSFIPAPLLNCGTSFYAKPFLHGWYYGHGMCRAVLPSCLCRATKDLSHYIKCLPCWYLARPLWYLVLWLPCVICFPPNCFCCVYLLEAPVRCGMLLHMSEEFEEQQAPPCCKLEGCFPLSLVKRGLIVRDTICRNG